MLAMGTSGLMSGVGKRDGASASAPALDLDSTICEARGAGSRPARERFSPSWPLYSSEFLSPQIASLAPARSADILDVEAIRLITEGHGQVGNLPHQRAGRGPGREPAPQAGHRRPAIPGPGPSNGLRPVPVPP